VLIPGMIETVDSYMLMIALQILKPIEKKQKYVYGGMNSGRPVTPPRGKKKAGAPGMPGVPATATGGPTK